MRLLKLLPAMLFAAAGFCTAHALPLPVGTYTLSGQTTATGVHQSVDQGTLTGTVTFDAASQVTAADLLFKDLTNGLSFTFTVPGLTEYIPQPQLLGTTIRNAVNPAIVYYFSIRTIPINGAYNLTCGVDCVTDVIIPDSTGRTTLNEEVFGNITPMAVSPEPSSLVLLGTGVLAVAGALRRRSASA